MNTHHQSKLCDLDAEFETSTTMTPASFTAKRAAILLAAEPAPPVPAPAPASKKRFATIDDVVLVAKNIAQYLVPVVARIARIEAKAVTGGIAIHADHVDVAGLQELARTLQAPTFATFDKSGRITGARRELGAAPAGADVLKRLEAAEARIAELEKESMSGVAKYCGVHAEGHQYAKGALVTRSGSMWHAEIETTARPGTSDDWRLAVKRGRA